MEVRSSSSLSVSEWAGRGVPQKQVSTVGMVSVSGAGAGAELDAIASMAGERVGGDKRHSVDGRRKQEGKGGKRSRIQTNDDSHLASDFKFFRAPGRFSNPGGARPLSRERDPDKNTTGIHRSLYPERYPRAFVCCKVSPSSSTRSRIFLNLGVSFSPS